MQIFIQNSFNMSISHKNLSRPHINKSGKVGLGEKVKNFIRKFIYYLGILFSICVAIYALYIAVPEILKILRNFILDLIARDYPRAEQIIPDSQVQIQEDIKK